MYQAQLLSIYLYAAYNEKRDSFLYIIYRFDIFIIYIILIIIIKILGNRYAFKYYNSTKIIKKDNG